MEDPDNFDFKLKIKIPTSISSNHLNVEKYRSLFLRPSPTQNSGSRVNLARGW